MCNEWWCCEINRWAFSSSFSSYFFFLVFLFLITNFVFFTRFWAFQIRPKKFKINLTPRLLLLSLDESMRGNQSTRKLQTTIIVSELEDLQEVHFYARNKNALRKVKNFIP